MCKFTIIFHKTSNEIWRYDTAKSTKKHCDTNSHWSEKYDQMTIFIEKLWKSSDEYFKALKLWMKFLKKP